MPLNFFHASDDGLEIQKVESEPDPDLYGLGPVVPLAEATVLYQPVKGSTNTYYAIALGPKFNVAARLHIAGHHAGSDVLSLRVEKRDGSAMSPQEASAITAAGFDLKGGYGSMHVSVSACDPWHAPQHAIGAVLMALNEPFWSKLPCVATLAKLCGQEGVK